MSAAGRFAALLLLLAAAGCMTASPPQGQANPAGAWRWDTRGPPGFVSTSFRGGDMN